MELTLDQAMQQGVAAHKEGKLQDAERLYRAILQIQPKHPDANHNLGVLAVSVGKPLEAISLFKLALEAKPQTAQFWLSYIDALIKAQCFDDAKRVLVEGGKSGVSSEKLDALKQRLQASVINDTNETAKGQRLVEKRKNLAKKKKSKKRQEQAASSSAEPSQDQRNQLLENYQAGRLAEAEALAASLIKKFRSHPFAWSLLGAIYRQAGRSEESLRCLQNSAQLSPGDHSVHFNCGVMQQALGRLDEAEASYRQAIALKADLAEAHSNLGNTLKALRRLDEAEASYKQAIALKPDFAEAHFNHGVTLQALNKLDDAVTSYKKSILLNHGSVATHVNLANTQRELGRLGDAEASYRQAIALAPNFSEAHCNLGVLLMELGRLHDAEASYRKAIALKPDFDVAHSNLGATLMKLGNLDDAEASLRRAVEIAPDNAHAYFNLGNAIRNLGRLDEACEAYVCAANLKPGFSNAFVNLGDALQNVRFNRPNRTLYPVLSDLLTAGSFVRPKQVAPAIISLLRHDPIIGDLLARPDAWMLDIKGVVSAIAALHHLPLLHNLMRICPLPDLKLEALFASIRRLLLLNLKEIEASPELTNFLSTLSLQCFTNEYVYFETEDESALVSGLETEIVECISQGSQPMLTGVLGLAAYRPLHQYAWSEELQALDQLPEIRTRLIEEPLAERVLAQQIPVLADVKDEMSRKVRDQYEENPYPRWVNLGIPLQSKSLARICNDAELELFSDEIKSVSSPSILIAGCGTGQHSIGSACSYSNCTVTAVDLSLTSLAYAQRKTIEHGVSNIEYLQADILQLGQLDRTFDIIESAGVLHHMEDPMAGWRILTGLLNVGGLMKIGLYSHLARQHIVAIREEIDALGVETSAADIRGFRKSLAESHDKNKRLLVTSNDFFSLSTLRDLIFHVQEHRFTLPQIKTCLNELGLRFCGFEHAHTRIAKFREFYGEQSNVYDLMLWHDFEKGQPRTFAGMYQFWCQKL